MRRNFPDRLKAFVDSLRFDLLYVLIFPKTLTTTKREDQRCVARYCGYSISEGDHQALE
jgi:hypothetical protein